jgi:6,7-dimethyl-8-ribityllumazine synthase
MLRKVKKGSGQKKGGRFAIVASCYNARYVDAMLRAARAELKRAGASVKVVRVPGAYEIPVAAARMAQASPSYDAIICLGVIFQGETAHAQHIGDAVSHALMRLQVDRVLPVIHCVQLFGNEQQAEVRCLGRKHNRGREASQTALTMAKVMPSLH